MQSTTPLRRSPGPQLRTFGWLPPSLSLFIYKFMFLMMSYIYFCQLIYIDLYGVLYYCSLNPSQIFVCLLKGVWLFSFSTISSRSIVFVLFTEFPEILARSWLVWHIENFHTTTFPNVNCIHVHYVLHAPFILVWVSTALIYKKDTNFHMSYSRKK